MKKLMVVGFAAMGAAMAFGNVNDDAAFIHYGAEFKADGDAYAWPDVRHGSTWNPSSVTGTHKTEGGGGKTGKTVAAVADVTTPTLGRTLRNEPVIRMNHEIVTNDQGVITYNCTSLGFRGCKAGQKVYSFLLRFRPNMGKDWVANGTGENERLACVSVNWGGTSDSRGIYVYLGGRTADGSEAQLSVLNNGQTFSTGFKVANGLWHELAVIVDMNVVTVGLCSEKFTSDPGCWKWASYTFPDGYYFGLNGPNSGSISRGTTGETQATSTRGDFHYLAMWYRALSKDEVYEAFSGGRSASALSFGLDTAMARAEAYCGGSGDATVALRPWGWSAMPPWLVKGQKVSFTFDVTASRDRLLQTLSVLPTDDSGAGTVDVSLDGKPVGSLDLAGGQPGELTLAADRLLCGTRTVTLERTDSAATTLALKGLSLGQVARKGNVFNDALFLKYGTLVENADGRAVGWPDYRHYSTWNPDNRVGTHVTTESTYVPADATRSVTMDVYSPTAGRTLSNEPVIRMGHQVITNEDGSLSFSQNELSIKGLTPGQKVWSLLVRFRPDLEGWNAGGEWDRMFCLSTTWSSNPELSRGLFIALSREGKIGFQNGNVNVWGDKLVVSNRVWHELAVIVSNNTIKAGLCNPSRDATGKGTDFGQWAWKKWTFSDKTQFGFVNDTGVLGRNIDKNTATSTTRGDYHMLAMWNRALDESEVCEAFASSHTPLVDVGFDTDGVAAEAFTGDGTQDVTLASARPWNWHNLPYALKAGRKISIPFTKESWHDGLPQVLRVYPDSASAAGTQVKVSIDGKAIADLALVPGQMDASTYLRASDIALGDHTLTIARTDSGAGDLVLAGVSIEGSWQVGPEKNNQVGSYATSNSDVMPYWFDAVCGGWASVSGFTRNDWNNGVGPSRFRFEIPEDMLAAGYRYRLQYKLWTAYRTPVAGHPVMFILNGVTNYLHHTETTEADYTTAQSFELDAALLKPGLNVFEFFDNRQIPDPAASGNHYVANTWTTLEYVRVLAKPPKTGFIFLVR